MFFNIHVVLSYCTVMFQHGDEISDKNNVQQQERIKPEEWIYPYVGTDDV